jgi:hypothetical protein
MRCTSPPQRAALAVQRQVAQAHVAQVLQAVLHLFEQQLEGLVAQRVRQGQLVEEAAQALQRQQHQVVQGQAGQGLQLRARPAHALGQEALFRRQHRVGIGLEPTRQSRASSLSRAPPQTVQGV